MTRLRLVFMGSPDFSVPVLRALIDAGHEIASVYSQPPRPAGRGHKERPCPVQAFALERGLPTLTPKTLKTEDAQHQFADLKADAAVVAAYGLILPKAVLTAPRLGCLNVHASLLPRWRGAAPIQHAILAGDAETGISIMQMDEGLDTGAVLLTDSVPIGPETTAETLHDTLAEVGSRLIVEALEGVAAGLLTPTAQPAEGATYAGKLAPDAGRLDWARTAEELARLVRAFTPWPGAWFEHAGQRIKVLAAKPEQFGGEAAPGTVLDDCLMVACGTGALRVCRLQRPGKSAMDAEACLRGFPIPRGTRFD